MTNPPVNILIVDDIVHNITALEALLARPDIAVLVADSGTAALDLLLKHEVALAILDVNMPGMNGFELAALMRGSPRTSHVPIIFLTATAQDASRTFRGYEAGAVDFLYKPFDPRILQSKVDVFVQLEQQKRQLAAQLVTTRQMLEANEMLMAVLSHDLRTPLGAVLASAEYLMRTAADEQSVTVAARVKNSSLRMARMVDQLLNLARLQGGRLPLQPRSIELATLCRSVIDEFASRENGKRIVFSSSGNTSGAWDTDLVWQAVSNLVSNALHHGAPGGDIGVEVDGDSVDSVRLKVSNLRHDSVRSVSASVQGVRAEHQRRTPARRSRARSAYRAGDRAHAWRQRRRRIRRRNGHGLHDRIAENGDVAARLFYAQVARRGRRPEHGSR